MPRPYIDRKVKGKIVSDYYKPRGIPLRDLGEVSLGVDELEALRLADYEGLYQAEAAERMGVSRQTFGNIVKSARKKVASALVNGSALKIEGGPSRPDTGFDDSCARGYGRGRRHRGGRA